MTKFYSAILSVWVLLGVIGEVNARVTLLNDYKMNEKREVKDWSCTELGSGYYNFQPLGVHCDSFTSHGRTCYNNCETTCTALDYPYTVQTLCTNSGGVVGESCTYSGVTRYKCSCPANWVTCGPQQQGVGTECTVDGGEKKYAKCQCPEGWVSCSNPKVGVGSSCEVMDGISRVKYYESCTCPNNYSVCVSPEIGDGTACIENGDTKYSKCKCPDSWVTCASPKVGVGSACTKNGVTKYESCQCPSGWTTCSSPTTGEGQACSSDGGALYASCGCNTSTYPYTSCSQGQTLSGSSCTDSNGVVHYSSCIWNADCGDGFVLCNCTNCVHRGASCTDSEGTKYQFCRSSGCQINVGSQGESSISCTGCVKGSILYSYTSGSTTILGCLDDISVEAANEIATPVGVVVDSSQKLAVGLDRGYAAWMNVGDTTQSRYYGDQIINSPVYIDFENDQCILKERNTNEYDYDTRFLNGAAIHSYLDVEQIRTVEVAWVQKADEFLHNVVQAIADIELISSAQAAPPSSGGNCIDKSACYMQTIQGDCCRMDPVGYCAGTWFCYGGASWVCNPYANCGAGGGNTGGGYSNGDGCTNGYTECPVGAGYDCKTCMVYGIRGNYCRICYVTPSSGGTTPEPPASACSNYSVPYCPAVGEDGGGGIPCGAAYAFCSKAPACSGYLECGIMGGVVASGVCAPAVAGMTSDNKIKVAQYHGSDSVGDYKTYSNISFSNDNHLTGGPDRIQVNGNWSTNIPIECQKSSDSTRYTCRIKPTSGGFGSNTSYLYTGSSTTPTTKCQSSDTYNKCNYIGSYDQINVPINYRDITCGCAYDKRYWESGEHRFYDTCYYSVSPELKDGNGDTVYSAGYSGVFYPVKLPYDDLYNNLSLSYFVGDDLVDPNTYYNHAGQGGCVVLKNNGEPPTYYKACHERCNLYGAPESYQSYNVMIVGASIGTYEGVAYPQYLLSGDTPLLLSAESSVTTIGDDNHEIVNRGPTYAYKTFFKEFCDVAKVCDPRSGSIAGNDHNVYTCDLGNDHCFPSVLDPVVTISKHKDWFDSGFRAYTDVTMHGAQLYRPYIGKWVDWKCDWANEWADSCNLTYDYGPSDFMYNYGWTDENKLPGTTGYTGYDYPVFTEHPNMERDIADCTNETGPWGRICRMYQYRVGGIVKLNSSITVNQASASANIPALRNGGDEVYEYYGDNFNYNLTNCRMYDATILNCYGSGNYRCLKGFRLKNVGESREIIPLKIGTGYTDGILAAQTASTTFLGQYADADAVESCEPLFAGTVSKPATYNIQTPAAEWARNKGAKWFLPTFRLMNKAFDDVVRRGLAVASGVTTLPFAVNEPYWTSIQASRDDGDWMVYDQAVYAARDASGSGYHDIDYRAAQLFVKAFLDYSDKFGNIPHTVPTTGGAMDEILTEPNFNMNPGDP